MNLQEILGNEELETKLVEVSVEEQKAAEAEMAKIDAELEKLYASEEYALESAMMMDKQLSVISKEEVTEETLEVLAYSLESIANYGKIDVELLVPSVEEVSEKKDGMIAKMKRFIANVIASFKTIYAKIMKYIVKWVNEARVFIGRKVSEEEIKAIKDAASAGKVKELDDKTKVNLLLPKAIGKKIDAMKIIPEGKLLAAVKSRLVSDLFESKEEYKKAKKATALADVGFKIVDAEVNGPNKIVVALKWIGKKEIESNILAKLRKASKETISLIFTNTSADTMVSVTLNKKELIEAVGTVTKTVNFKDVKIDELIKYADTNAVKGIINTNFDVLKEIESNFKTSMDELKKKKNVTTEEVLIVKQDFLTASKVARSNMFAAVSEYKNYTALVKTLAKWAKESK